MSDYKRILTIQDISCFGQCSLTVALPIISACGIECVSLPSAVLSTHTYNFTGYTFRDLTEDIPKIAEHWNKENIKFDAVYTGYIGSIKQIDYIKNIMKSPAAEDAVKIVDPAMGDNGRLYPGFDDPYAKATLSLCMFANIILPNITEACYMLDHEYKEHYDEDYVKELANKLYKKTGAKVVLTGVSYENGRTGVVVYDNEGYSYYEHYQYPVGSHGTGDVYSAAFVGAYMRGKTVREAAKIAADFTVSSIAKSKEFPDHWYGPVFEPVLSELIEAVK